MMRYVPVLGLLAALSLFAPEARASEVAGEHHTMHRSPHTEHSSWLLGIKGVQLSAFNEGKSEFGGGMGVFGERTVVPGWLEVELSVSLVRLPEDTTILPADLLFKKPFHIGPLCPYFGIGPTVSIVSHEGTEAFFGGVAVVGAYYWFSEGLGFDLELDYALVAEDGVQHEITIAAGPTLRF